HQGLRSGYDWGGVAMAAITSGVGQTNLVTNIAKNAFLRGAAMAAASDLASYALHKAFGEEAHFSWRSIAADALAGGISAKLFGPAATQNGAPVAANVKNPGWFSWSAVAKVATTSVVRQGISYAAHKAIEGEAHWNNGQVLAGALTDVASTVAGMWVHERDARAAEQAMRLQLAIEQAQGNEGPFGAIKLTGATGRSSWMLDQSGVVAASASARPLDDILLADVSDEAFDGTRTYPLPPDPEITWSPLPGETWADTGLFTTLG